MFILYYKEQEPDKINSFNVYLWLIDWFYLFKKNALKKE